MAATSLVATIVGVLLGFGVYNMHSCNVPMIHFSAVQVEPNAYVVTHRVRDKEYTCTVGLGTGEHLPHTLFHKKTNYRACCVKRHGKYRTGVIMLAAASSIIMVALFGSLAWLLGADTEDNATSAGAEHVIENKTEQVALRRTEDLQLKENENIMLGVSDEAQGSRVVVVITEK